MKHLAITGNLGSGKTTVCLIFETLGVPVYYSDYRAKILMYKSSTLKLKIKALLGSEAYHKNGRPNRSVIASKIFSDQKLLEKMNALVHPAVAEDYLEWRNQQKSPFTLQESALTYEIDADKKMDAVIVVYAPTETLIMRGMNRDKSSRKAVEARLAKQMNQEEKISRADYTINNDGETKLIPQVLKIYHAIIDS